MRDLILQAILLLIVATFFIVGVLINSIWHIVINGVGLIAAITLFTRARIPESKQSDGTCEEAQQGFDLFDKGE